MSGHKPRRCFDCGWKPVPRIEYPEKPTEDWHEHPAVIHTLLARRPEFAGMGLVGTRVAESLVESA